MIDMDEKGNKLTNEKFQTIILKNKNVIKLLELCQLWLKKENSEIKNVVIQH